MARLRIVIPERIEGPAVSTLGRPSSIAKNFLHPARNLTPCERSHKDEKQVLRFAQDDNS